MLCAYNGFKFDFRIILHHLKLNNISLPDGILLVDPWLDNPLKKFENRDFKSCYLKMFDLKN